MVAEGFSFSGFLMDKSSLERPAMNCCRLLLSVKKSQVKAACRVFNFQGFPAAATDLGN